MSANYPAPVLRAHDRRTGLTGRLDVVLGADDEVTAALVEVVNEADHDLVVSYHDDPLVTVTVAATDRAGVPLIPAPPLPDTSRGGRQVNRTLSPGTSVRWLVPLADRMPVDGWPRDRLPGRLFISVALDVTATGGDPADPVGVILTMYDPRVEFRS